MNGHGSATGLVLATLAIAASVALLVSGCSEIGFPAVHDMPAPRGDTTLTPDQVKQATDDLISERDHLSTEAQASGQSATSGQPNTAANGAGTVPSAAQKKPPSSSALSAPPAARQAAASGATP